MKQLWKEKHNAEVDSDTSPLSDGEYEEVRRGDSGDAHCQQHLMFRHLCAFTGGDPSCIKPERSPEASAAKGTPPPSQKKRKKSDQQDEDEEVRLFRVPLQLSQHTPLVLFPSTPHNIAYVLVFLQDDINLAEILRSFKLPDGHLEFSFEELFKATTMHKTVSQP